MGRLMHPLWAASSRVVGLHDRQVPSMMCCCASTCCISVRGSADVGCKLLHLSGDL
jgi:hypothetical protein